ncbi:hypothetical protein QYE76_019423 [Lolium multiflorum]|uniref:F-box domain-containing protein n=1 Tax=Lolium multiflorum TaxID=4521 RepID=A0AAD8R3Y0_LOLMU|nr:hypothetical protein QYE76_019423 [Lolium multiflorum]
MSRRRSSPAPLDDDDLLGEILLRLPPQPSSLPRASLVCARWRIVLSDPQFLGRFRKRHGKPPLLGFFTGDVGRRHVFTPVLGSPDRILAARFSVPWSRKGYDRWDLRGCRHGLAVLVNDRGRGVVVWDPLTGQHRHHRVPFSPNPRYGVILTREGDKGEHAGVGEGGEKTTFLVLPSRGEAEEAAVQLLDGLTTQGRGGSGGVGKPSVARGEAAPGDGR